MKVKIDWIETKAEDWKVAMLTDDKGTSLKEVSINRKSKKGELFPNFDTLASGQEVEGQLWQSTAGKWYLFPPQPETTSGGASRSSGGAFNAKQIEEHTIRKEGFIKETIENKERAIQMAGAERDAVLLVTTFYSPIWMKDPILEHELDKLIKDKVVFFRDWLLSADFTNTIPF